MPRTPLEPRFSVEYLSILDSDGNLDSALEPDLSATELKRLYRAMLLGRRLDERMVRLQRQGRIGTFAPIKGQEASQLGSVCTLRESDWMVPSFRETAAMLWRGWPIEKLLMTFAGQLEGCQPAPEQHDLPITIPVGTQLPQPLKKQTHSRTIAQKALAYGLPGLQVDGNDVLAVYAATKEAVDRAREGNGPTLIECVTYRLGVHTTADDPTKYRSEEEVREWERKDPLTRFVEYLRKKNLLEDGLEQEVDAEIAAAVKRFEAMAPPDVLTMFDHAYAEKPPELLAQREEVASRLRSPDESTAAPEPPPSPPMRGQRKTSRWQN